MDGDSIIENFLSAHKNEISSVEYDWGNFLQNHKAETIFQHNEFHLELFEVVDNTLSDHGIFLSYGVFRKDKMLAWYNIHYHIKAPNLKELSSVTSQNVLILWKKFELP